MRSLDSLDVRFSLICMPLSVLSDSVWTESEEEEDDDVVLPTGTALTARQRAAQGDTSIAGSLLVLQEGKCLSRTCCTQLCSPTL